MLAIMRKAARSWVSFLLISLLILSFAIWGINDVFRGAVPDAVAEVAGESIGPEEYRQEFDRLLKRANQESGQEMTTQAARQQGIDNAVLERMVGERAFSAFTSGLGIRASDATVREEIGKIPAFQDPTTQRFSEGAYAEALRANGFTVAGFERTVRDDLARQIVTMAATSGLRAPAMISRQALAYATERRIVSVIPVPASLAGAPRQPDAAQLQAFYTENRQALMRPESRSLTLVVATLADFESRATIDPAQARQAFEAQKARLSTPAKRSFVQIVAPDKAKADAAAARLRAGDDAAAIARDLGLQAPLTFADSTAAQVPDRKIGEAVFAAAAGAVGSTQGALAFAAWRVTSATPAREARFEDVAATINAELRKEAAGQALTDATEAYDDALSEGGTMEAAAQKAGFRVVKVPGIIADGRAIADGQPVAELAEARDLLRQVFAAGKGDTTDLVTVPGDRYIAARVDEISAAAPPPLEQVRAELAQEWTRRDLAARLKRRAEEILADAKANGFEAAARKANLPVIRQPQPLLRGQGGQGLGEAVFGAKKGEIVVGPTANGVEYAVVRVEQILRDDEGRVPERLGQAEQAMRQAIQRDILASLDRAARDRADAKLYPDRMGRALGDTAETAAGGNAVSGNAVGGGNAVAPAAPAAPASKTP